MHIEIGYSYHSGRNIRRKTSWSCRSWWLIGKVVGCIGVGYYETGSIRDRPRERLQFRIGGYRKKGMRYYWQPDLRCPVEKRITAYCGCEYIRIQNMPVCWSRTKIVRVYESDFD